MKLKNFYHKYLRTNDLVLLLALVLAIALVWNTIVAMQKNYRLQQKYDRLSAEVELLELENQNLRYEIEYRKTDAYLELEARDKFSKAAPGEKLVYLPNNGKDERSKVAKDTENKAERVKRTGIMGNLEAWWLFITGHSGEAVR